LLIVALNFTVTPFSLSLSPFNSRHFYLYSSLLALSVNYLFRAVAIIAIANLSLSHLSLSNVHKFIAEDGQFSLVIAAVIVVTKVRAAAAVIVIGHAVVVPVTSDVTVAVVVVVVAVVVVLIVAFSLSLYLAISLSPLPSSLSLLPLLLNHLITADVINLLSL
jgi:hypothetical protein